MSETSLPGLFRRHLDLCCRRLAHLLRMRGPAPADSADADAGMTQATLAALDEEIESLVELLADEPPPLHRLAAAAGLGAEASALFLAAAAFELYPEFRSIARGLEASDGEVLLAGGLLRLVFPDPATRLDGRQHLQADGPLASAGLVELQTQRKTIREDGVDSLDAMRVRVPEHVLLALTATPGLPAWTAPYARRVVPDRTLDDVLLDREGALVLASVVRRLHQGRGPDGPGTELVLLRGTNGCGRSTIAAAFAGSLGRPLLRVATPLVAGAFDGRGLAERLLALVACARFQGDVLFFDDAQVLAAKASPFGAHFAAVVEAAGFPVVVATDTTDVEPALAARAVADVSLGAPDVSQRRELWRQGLSASTSDELERDLTPVETDTLARQFRFSGGQVSRAVWLAAGVRVDRAGEAARLEPFTEASHALLPSRLGQFTMRIPARLTLDDLVVPDEQRRLIEELVGACRNRLWVLENWGFGKRLVTGHGIVALFDGEPGTGKTLTAGILSSELDIPLYRINVSQIVDKYVGETEKHIERIFQAAHASQAVLLFDEADALFTKRVRVDSSNDRYANLQTNTLLQEIEAYDGVVVLTTNLECNIDAAFQRRIHFRVTFPFPDATQRAAIWRKLLPPELPLAAPLDFASLGDRFELAGGNIKNVLLRAAYRAREARQPLAPEMIEEVAAAECRAAGKLFRAVTGRRKPAPV